MNACEPTSERSITDVLELNEAPKRAYVFLREVHSSSKEHQLSQSDASHTCRTHTLDDSFLEGIDFSIIG